MRDVRTIFLAAALAALGGCGPGPRAADAEANAAARAGAAASDTSLRLPPGADDAAARLATSPRHAEWRMVDAGDGDSVRVWLAYPEAARPAPVVLVVHEIFGLTRWIRGVADQLAADGYVAVAPDLLTGENVPWEGEEPVGEAARAAIATLDRADVQRRLDAAARWAMALPGAAPRYAIVGFCWGGTVAFEHAAHTSDVATAVVYYGSAPEEEALRAIRSPVLGLYGENDARVNATIPRAASVLGRGFESAVFPGAGHGFLRAQQGQGGANLEATRNAWPRTLEWLNARIGSSE